MPDLNLTAAYALGEKSAGVGYFAGDQPTVIIFNRALSAAEINLVGEYLAARYGQDWITRYGYRALQFNDADNSQYLSMVMR